MDKLMGNVRVERGEDIEKSEREEFLRRIFPTLLCRYLPFLASSVGCPKARWTAVCSGLRAPDRAAAKRRRRRKERSEKREGTTINLDRQQSSRCYLAAPESRREEDVDKRRR
jgi:hypothetical protein